MKRLALVPLVLVLVAAPAFAQEKTGSSSESAPSPFKSDKEKASYALGLQIAENLKGAGLGDVDQTLLAKGLADMLGGKKPSLSPEEAQLAIRAYLLESKSKQAAENKKQGEAFLAENKKKEGVKTLESGLQYKVLKSGKGESPKLEDSVVAHYRGTLIDGTVFDSSYDRGRPATFPVAGVIAGWTEALQKMKVGDKWQLFIPSELAYKAGGTPDGAIPPNAALIFEVELISIEK